MIEARTRLNETLHEVRARWTQVAKEKEVTAPEITPVDLRTAALVLAVRRVAQVTLGRGIWP